MTPCGLGFGSGWSTETSLLSSQDLPAELSQTHDCTDQVHQLLEVGNSCMDFLNRKPNCTDCVQNTSSRSALTTFWPSEQRRHVPSCIKAGMAMQLSNLWAQRLHQSPWSTFSASPNSRNSVQSMWTFTSACSGHSQPSQPGSSIGTGAGMSMRSSQNTADRARQVVSAPTVGWR